MPTIKKHLKIRLIFGILVLILGFLVNYFSANYIYYKNLDCIEKNPDILLDQFTKPHPNFMIITEIILVLGLLLFIYINRKEKGVFVDSIILFGIFQILRGLFLPLTILGGIGGDSILRNYITFSRGLFPSGHSALILVFLFNTKRFKWIFLVISILVMLGLIISQQHYTIDILSSVIFIYAIKSFMEKNL